MEFKIKHSSPSPCSSDQNKIQILVSIDLLNHPSPDPPTLSPTTVMVPQEELPILEALVNIKHRLTALKKDTTRFIRAKDVMSIYQQLVKEIKKLNQIRDRASEEHMLSSSSAAVSPPHVEPETQTRSRSVSRTDSNNRVNRSRQASIDSVAPTDTADRTETSSAASDGYSSVGGPSRTISGMSTPAEEPIEAIVDDGSDSGIMDKNITPTQQQLPEPETIGSHISTVTVYPPSEPNRVDQVLNDVFTLVSLFFLTIGKTKESPGTFCQIASMRQLLDHMNESGIYTQQDLQPFCQRLNVLKMIIRKDKEEGRHPEAIFKLMMRKLEDTERLLQTLLKSLSVLSVELVPIHQRLVHIRRQLAALAIQLKPSKNDIKPLVEELRKIDSSRVDGKFLGPGGSSVPTGQAILVGLLEECFDICQDIRARDGEESVAPPLKPVFERLSGIKAKLERLQLTHRWTLRETDLYNYSQALREVERMRVDGSFVDAEGNKAEGQYVSVLPWHSETNVEPVACLTPLSLYLSLPLFVSSPTGTSLPPSEMSRSDLSSHRRV